MDITVLICTYNSQSRITETLEHLRKQEVPAGIEWEILVVDYQSTDRTEQICEAFKSSSPVSLAFITETRPGKSAALVTGFARARGRFVCIVDDDNWVNADYISVAFRTMDAHGDVGMIGGLGKPHFEGKEPEWFDDFQGVYAVGPQSAQPGYLLADNNWLWGAASVVRKAAWETIIAKGFRFILNPSRDGLSMFKKGFAGGEDQELCYAVQLSGYKLWYEPALQYTHFISANRLTENYLLKTISGTNTAAPVLKFYLSQLTADTPKGRMKKKFYTVAPLMFAHDIYVLLMGLKGLFSSKYKKIVLYSTWARFKAGFKGLVMINGQKTQVLNDIMKLK